MSEIQKPSRKKKFFIGFIIFLLGIVAAGGFNIALDRTNTTEFCTSCHSMQINLTELKETTHWLNRTGVHAGCADCHVPKAFIPKMYAKLMAAKDVWHELLGTIDTPEKFEARRWEMANRVWAKMEATNSRECRSCHAYTHMDLSEQDRFARKKHEKAVDRDQTCIDCHKGIAHQLPEEPEGAEKPATQETDQ